MQKRITEPNQMRCDYLKVRLEGEGIKCYIQNELSAGGLLQGYSGR
ncbi:MAG: hypothetical protein PF904_07520 [Kiritimatiellae bacterium]|jgi:hypothetical protein|nr:hypothetical protein [Kiritimatiellia bacterium]